jgi:hypothetical protein
MVAGPEKEILRGREFAKRDKMRARQGGHLKGIHRRREEWEISVGRQESSHPKCRSTAGFGSLAGVIISRGRPGMWSAL